MITHERKDNSFKDHFLHWPIVLHMPYSPEKKKIPQIKPRKRTKDKCMPLSKRAQNMHKRSHRALIALSYKGDL